MLSASLNKTHPSFLFYSETGKGLDEDKKLKSGIIRLGAIRDAIAKRRHCLLDVTPHHVDRLNYAQYCPIVVFLKPEAKQAVKEIRSKYRGHSKNPKKVFEHNEKLEKFYSHLFTSKIRFSVLVLVLRDFGFNLGFFMLEHLWIFGARCSSVVRAFAYGAMGRRIDPSWGGPTELFLVPASAPRLV